MGFFKTLIANKSMVKTQTKKKKITINYNRWLRRAKSFQRTYLPTKMVEVTLNFSVGKNNWLSVHIILPIYKDHVNFNNL